MDDTRQEQTDNAPQNYHIAGTLNGDTVKAINSGRLDAEDIQTLLSMTREFPWKAVGDTASTEMSRLHDVSVQQGKRITELEALLSEADTLVSELRHGPLDDSESMRDVEARAGDWSRRVDAMLAERGKG